MGFFTVCPGRPVYDIGSPIFEETRLTLAGGNVFTITARNVSAANKYYSICYDEWQGAQQAVV